MPTRALGGEGRCPKLPRRRGHRPDDQRRDDGEEAVDQRCRDRVGLVRAERDEDARQPELDEPDAARRDRDQAEDAGQRPGGEHLDDRDLGSWHADRSDRRDQDEEDREVSSTTARASRGVDRLALASIISVNRF